MALYREVQRFVRTDSGMNNMKAGRDGKGRSRAGPRRFRPDVRWQVRPSNCPVDSGIRQIAPCHYSTSSSRSSSTRSISTSWTSQRSFSISSKRARSSIPITKASILCLRLIGRHLRCLRPLLQMAVRLPPRHPRRRRVLQTPLPHPAHTIHREVSITLTDVPLSDILGYVIAQTNLQYTVEDYAVYLRPSIDEGETLTVRTYLVPPNFFPGSTTPCHGGRDYGQLRPRPIA